MVMPKSNVPTPPNVQQKPKIVVGTGGVPTPPNSTTQTVNRVSTPQPPTSSVPTPPKGISAAPAITSTPSLPTSSVPMPPQSNYRQELDNLLNQYRDLANTPVNYNPQTDPRYQAYQQLANQRAGVASRNALETMNERGIVNSSVTSNQLGQIQQQAEQQALAAIPQFYEQAYAQRQNELNNLGNLINMYAGQDDTMFNRDQAMFNRGITEAQLTEMYIPSQAQPIINQLLQLKQEAERPDLGAETYAAYRAQGDQLRNQLRAMGVDPSFIEANVTSGQAATNIPDAFATASRRNRMAEQENFQQQMEYQAARDAIADQRYQQQFDRDTEQWGLQFALNKQIQLGNLDVARMREATNRMNANTSRYSAETSRLDADRRYSQYQDSLNQPQSASIGPNDYKTSPDFATDYQYIVSNPEAAKQQLQNNAAAFIQTYGYDGYRALLAALPKEDQNELERFLTGG